jgi:hypothetical protein
MFDETQPVPEVPAPQPDDVQANAAPMVQTPADASVVPASAPEATADAPAQSRNAQGQFTAAPAADVAPSPEPAPEAAPAPEPAPEAPAAEASVEPVAEAAAPAVQFNSTPDVAVNPLQAENDHLKQQLADEQRRTQQAIAAYEHIRDAHGTAGAAPADVPLTETEALQSRLEQSEADNAHLKEQIVHLQNAQAAQASDSTVVPIVHLTEEALGKIKSVVAEVFSTAPKPDPDAKPA